MVLRHALSGPTNYKLAAVADVAVNIFPSPGCPAAGPWTQRIKLPQAIGVESDWTSIASSADGSKLIAAAGVAGGGQCLRVLFLLSISSGAAWKLTATNIVSGLTAHQVDQWFCFIRRWQQTGGGVRCSPLGIVITSTSTPVPYGLRTRCH